jgi:hypothetical protein
LQSDFLRLKKNLRHEAMGKACIHKYVTYMYDKCNFKMTIPEASGDSDKQFS